MVGVGGTAVGTGVPGTITVCGMSIAVDSYPGAMITHGSSAHAVNTVVNTMITTMIIPKDFIGFPIPFLYSILKDALISSSSGR